MVKSKIQSVLIPKTKSKLHAVNFPKEGFTLKQSHKWLLKHNFKIPKKVDETINFYRYRQKLPDKRYTYTTKVLPNGVELVLMWKKPLEGGITPKNRLNELVEKILETLTEKDIDEFQTAQLGELNGSGIAVDSKLKVYQMKQIIEDVIKQKPELVIKYKSAKKTKLIEIIDQLEKDGLLSTYNFYLLPKKNPKSPSVGDILLKFGEKKKALTDEEQKEFIKEFENNPKYQNIYEGAEQDIRTGQKIKPLDHQKKFIQQFALSNLRGVIAFHGVGSGKTLTAVISSYYFLKLYPDRKVIVISPSALLFNFLQGMVQYGLNVRDNRYKFFTYDKYLRSPFDTTGCLVIVDEAHNFRTEIQKTMQLDDKGNEVEIIKTNKRGFKLMNTASKNAYKIILLTGTAFVNKIYDVENLLAMVDNREPISEKSFTDAITNPLNLSSYFNYKISYYERGADSNFPSRKDIVYPIIMTEDEEDEYNEIKMQGPPNKDSNKNSFYNSEQYASNTIKDNNGINPKVKYIINLIKNKPNEKFIIYSSFIHTGIDNLVKSMNELKLSNTKPVFITGRESAAKKEESKTLFNNFKMKNSNIENPNSNNEYRILFITKAGAEGVDTKNCNNIVLFDELWNDATAEQIIARAIRYKSHQELPENERYVNVIRPLFIKKSDEDLFELLLEEAPKWDKISQKINDYKIINKEVDNGLSNNKIMSLPNFNLLEFKMIASSVPKIEGDTKDGQRIRRAAIRKLEQQYLDKVEENFKNGEKGFIVKYKNVSDDYKYIKNYQTIKTAYGKKNLIKGLPEFDFIKNLPYFDKNEYKKATDENQEMIYLIQVQEAYEIQNKKSVLSPDLLSSIERDEKKPIPAVDLFKFILTKSKEQRIRYFIEHFDVNNKNTGDISLYEYYESKYRKILEEELKRTGKELTPELEFKILKDIILKEMGEVSDILFTNTQKNKIEEFNKRTKAEKLQQFYTPPDVAYDLADKIFENIENMEDIKILEPTAGQGGLLIPFIKPRNNKLIEYNKTNVFNIDLVELDPENRVYLKKLENRGQTFLNLEEEPNFLKFMTSNRYNIIITNPPFHLRKEENIGFKRDVYDVDFIFRAIVFLKVGGTLGAIIGKASEDATDRKKYLKRLGEIGNFKMETSKKYKFGIITTPVLFIFFTKTTEEFDEELLNRTNDIFEPMTKTPDFLQQPIEPPKPTPEPTPEPEPIPEIILPEPIQSSKNTYETFSKRLDDLANMGSKGQLGYVPAEYVTTFSYAYLMDKYKSKCPIFRNYKEINYKAKTGIAYENRKIIGPEHLGKYLKNCIDRGEDLIVFPLLLPHHANLMIFRPYQKIIERYEPHGSEYGASGLSDDLLNKTLRKYFEETLKPELKEFTPRFKTPLQICPIGFTKGLQSIEGLSNLKKKIEGGGYCQIWALFLLENILLNPTISTQEIIKNIIDISKSNPDYLLNLIRGYVSMLSDNIKELVKKLGNTFKDLTIRDKSIYDHLKNNEKKQIFHDYLNKLVDESLLRSKEKPQLIPEKEEENSIEKLKQIITKEIKPLSNEEIQYLYYYLNKNTIKPLNIWYGDIKKLRIHVIKKLVDKNITLKDFTKNNKWFLDKGGNINNEELSKFVDAGYKTKSEAENIDGYTLDKELSTKRDKVYANKEGKVIHTIAGTDKLKDWTNNLLIPLGLHTYSNRYKNAEKIQKEANKKYGKENVSVVSHSQSGNIAQNLAKKKLVGDENVTLNPAIIGSHKPGLKVVKSSGDIVSALTIKNKKDKTINTGSWNPLYNHSSKILTKKKK